MKWISLLLISDLCIILDIHSNDLHYWLWDVDKSWLRIGVNLNFVIAVKKLFTPQIQLYKFPISVQQKNTSQYSKLRWRYG
jgi:hypothetical protein